jgi:hypothetical protein
MDLSINKSAKDFLKAQFQNWHAEQVVTYIDKNSDKVEAVKIKFIFYVVYVCLFLNKLSKSFLCAIFGILKLYTSSLIENCIQAFNIPLLNYYNIFDLSLTKMKPLGAKWLVKLYDHLCSNPAIIRNGF